MANKKKQHRLKLKTPVNRKVSSNNPSAVNLSNFVVSIRKSKDLFSRYTLFIETLLLILIIIIGVFFRIDDLSTWEQNRTRAFFKDDPIHTTFDAWFYLSLSKDLMEKTYYKVDEKRGIPNSPKRPSPPPLISVIAATIAKNTAYSLSWIGAVLPTILGPLLAIPVFLLGRFYGGPLAGLSAALICLLYPYYVHRSNIGRFDTDCLNVVWATSAIYVFLRFGICEGIKRYLYFAAGIIIFALFLWWWDQTPSVVGAITFTPLIIALLFFYRVPRKEWIIFYGLLAAGITVFIVYSGLDMPLRAVKEIFSQFKYISKQSFDVFPNIGVTISEQSKPSLEMILSYTSQNALSFIFSLSGIIWLFIKKGMKGLFLSSLLLLSILAFSYANRFIIFLIPVLALGAGFSIKSLWDLRSKFLPLYFLCPLILILLIFPLYKANARYVQWPKENGITVEALDYIKNNTPENAIVWAWWDHGYAITYWARRGTVNDGSIHSGERTVYTAIPYSTDSFRLAANFMQFYTARGMNGIRLFYRSVGSPEKGLDLIKKILDSGPEKAEKIIGELNLSETSGFKDTSDWLSFFFPADQRPLYLLADNLLTKICYWWYWFGSWDIKNQNGIHPSYNFYYNLNFSKNKIYNNSGLQIDTRTGRMFIGNQGAYQLSHVLRRSTNKISKNEFNLTSKMGFEFLDHKRCGAVMDSNMSESVFNKLFIRHQFPAEYFKPVRLRTPYYQIWKVRGDTFTKKTAAIGR